MGEAIRVSTQAHLFEQRKQEYVASGYRIESEQPRPINGLCSFVAIRTTDSSRA